MTLRVVAKYADVWNFVGGGIDAFRHKNEVLNGHCAEIGRDPATIERSIQWPINYNNMAESRDGMRPYIAEGANHIILNLRAPYPEGIAHRLAEEVIAPLRAEFEGR